MVMFYLRNFAPEEFGGARREVSVPERPRVPAITRDTTPEEAVKIWEQVIMGAEMKGDG